MQDEFYNLTQKKWGINLAPGWGIKLNLDILRLLLEHRGESTREGQGYVELAMVIQTFEDIFDNREDLIARLTNLLERQLIETNTRSTETIRGASHIRVTSAGWYYSLYLVNSFAYLDLVLQDTPLNNSMLADELKDMVFRVDNMSDREDEKIPRTEIRFARVEKFLDYLENEEQIEIKDYRLDKLDSVFAAPFLQNIRINYFKQKSYISRRIKENREKYAEDTLFDDVIKGDDLAPLLSEEDEKEDTV